MTEETPENNGYFRLWRGNRLLWLIQEKPDALRLLLLIQFRARYSDEWNPMNLKRHQAVLGYADVEPWGWTQRRYRTAKSDLEIAGAVDFVGDRRGTRATLTNTVAYINSLFENGRLNDIQSDSQSDRGATDPRQTPDRGATDPRQVTKKENKGNKGKEGEVKDFPPTGPVKLPRASWTKDKLLSQEYQQYPGFCAWWKKYPRSEDKRAVFMVWVKEGVEFEDQEQILEVLDYHKNTPSWKKDGGEFIPRAMTYLNRQSYLDEVEEKNKAGAGRVSAAEMNRNRIEIT